MANDKCNNPECDNRAITGYCSVTCGNRHMEIMYGAKASSTSEDE